MQMAICIQKFQQDEQFLILRRCVRCMYTMRLQNIYFGSSMSRCLYLTIYNKLLTGVSA